MIEIGSPILGWWILKKWDNITASFRSDEENKMLVNDRAEILKDAIVQGKSVTFIKSGQALALRPDIVKSAEYIRELQKLQDEVGNFNNDIAMDIIRNELGCDPNDIYDFDPILPIASASIGQVYKAKLRYNNATVAVKVQRPDALESAPIDMYILRTVAGFIRKQKKLRTDLVAIADEFGSQLYNELNYVKEARNCIRFKELYGNISGIYVPNVYLNHTTSKVLTMEFVEGVKGPWETGGERMLTLGLQCSVLQLLGTGFFHSDPHRGNLLQTPSGDLAYLDFGMMSEVPAKERYALIGTVVGLVNKDLTMVINNLQTLSFFPDSTNTTVVIEALEQAVANSTMDKGVGSSLNFTRLNQNIERISDKLPFRLPPFYTLIIRTLTILEGLALYVDPSFRLIRGAYPFIAKQILTSNNPELMKLLRSIVINPVDEKIRWDKLEQVLSISSNADSAMQGDFNALKHAQDRSDLIKAYNNQQVDSNYTMDVILTIVDFLLSENGQVIREPLINEIVDSLDAMGLTVASFASVITNGIIPKPRDKPDKEKIDQLLALLRNALVSMNNRGDDGPGPGKRDTPPVMSIIENLLLLVRNPPVDKIDKIQVLWNKSSTLVRQVIGRLAERNIVRSIKFVINEGTITNSFPLLARTIDTLLK